MKTVEQIEQHLKIIREHKRFMTAESKKPGVTPEHAQKFLEIAQLRRNEEFMLLWVLDVKPSSRRSGERHPGRCREMIGGIKITGGQH
jgi:hypothetical protein